MPMIAALLLMTLLALFLFAKKPGDKPSRVEPVGPFEILTHEMRYTTGWNEGQLRRATTENFSIRYKGSPLSFVGRAGLFTDEEQRYERFNSVITFPCPEPAIVINVGDPNNRSFYYLIREKNGSASIDLLGESSASVTADWLDPAPGSSPLHRDLAVHRSHLEGGRLLLLGDYTVLDTTTLESFAVQPSSSISPAVASPPVELSPDRRSFIRIGDSGRELRIVVYDFVGGETYSLPIDRSRMRYGVIEEINSAWVDHHFVWKRSTEGPDRLETRSDFTPLPYKGRLTTDPYDSYREYRLQPVSREMQSAVVAFLEAELSGERQPRREYSSTDEINVRGNRINVMFSDDHVGVWTDRGVDSSIMIEIAAALDRHLATGEWDGYFSQP